MLPFRQAELHFHPPGLEIERKGNDGQTLLLDAPAEPLYLPRMHEKLSYTLRKARHDYFILSTQEAGIVLQGTEVKSIRAGRLNLKDSYAKVKNGELWLIGMHISPYEQGNIYNHDPERVRKLLMHAR